MFRGWAFERVNRKKENPAVVNLALGFDTSMVKNRKENKKVENQNQNTVVPIIRPSVLFDSGESSHSEGGNRLLYFAAALRLPLPICPLGNLQAPFAVTQVSSPLLR